MFAQHGKTGYNEGDGKEKDKIPRRNLDQIICNDCGDKVHYAGNIDWPTQTKLKEYEDAFRNTKQEKYSNKPPGGGYQKPLVNVKYAFCSIMMGDPTEEWGEPPSPGLMFCQTLTQEAPYTEPIKNNMKKGKSIRMHVGDTILSAAEEAGINENLFLIDNQSTCNTFINGK